MSGVWELSKQAMVRCRCFIWYSWKYSWTRSLCLSKALCKQSRVTSIYMLDYILPQVAKLTKSLQTEHLDLSMILSLVDATVAIGWLGARAARRLWTPEECAGIEVTIADITMFKGHSAKPFVPHLKRNISSRFASSSKVASAMSIFVPRKAPKKHSLDCQYGEQAIFTLDTLWC